MNAKEKMIAMLESKPELAAKIDNINTDEEVVAFFAENGIDVTVEEVREVLAEGVIECAEPENGELSEENLDNVAGGLALTLGLIATAWGVGSRAGMILRNMVDKKKGYKATYTWDEIKSGVPKDLWSTIKKALT